MESFLQRDGVKIPPKILKKEILGALLSPVLPFSATVRLIAVHIFRHNLKFLTSGLLLAPYSLLILQAHI
jgi:hypothetical protein